MSLDFSPKESLISRGSHTTITLSLKNSTPLLKLSQVLPWDAIYQLIRPDLEKSAGPYHHLGRKLHVEQHLKILIIQGLYQLTDRAVAMQTRVRADFRIFCSIAGAEEWLIPDHSQICRFRNRISAETSYQLNALVLRTIAELGLTDFTSMDLDSTVQEANMAYPSDATLMRKLAYKTEKVISFLQSIGHQAAGKVKINLEAISTASKAYFFRSKTASIEKTREIFAKYHATVSRGLREALQVIQNLRGSSLANMPWNIRLHCDQVREKAFQYLKDVGHFIKTHSIKKTKILSFHVSEAICITKGKLGKTKEFGRQYQVGRFAGNFLHVFSCSNLSMNDKLCLQSLLRETQDLFGERVLKELSTDKGYYSHQNITIPRKQMGINTDGIARPSRVAEVHRPGDPRRAEELRKRRAGIEPLIAHLKSYGLGKSKMKSDRATLSQGYRSALFFNCKQLMRTFQAKS